MKQISTKESHYYDTFKIFLEDTAARHGQKIAITTYDRKGVPSEVTYTQMKEDAFAVARAMYANGLAGRHVAVLGENSYQWLSVYFGIAVSGGTAVCIDIDHTDDIIMAMLKQADVRAIVASESMAELAVTFGRENYLEKLIVMGDASAYGISLESFKASGDVPEARQWLAEFEPDGYGNASIVFTSGTTSTAKPVMLSHRAILYNAADSLTLLDSRDRVFNSLPLYHTYGLTCGMLCALIRGLNICISCDMKRLMQEMTLFKPGMLVAVPLIIEIADKLFWGLFEKNGKKAKIQRMIKLEGAVHKPGSLIAADVKECIKGSFLENLDVILSGGAYLSNTVATELLHFGVVVLQGYGITECAPSISCNRNEDFSLDSVGVPLPGWKIKFEDDEILVKGYSLMNGYYGAEQLTKESIDEDGWFHTGDIGYMDKKGQMHITGRKKNLIVMKNGKKVAAEEMENELKKMPLVKEVLVYGAMCGNSADDVKIAAAVYPDPERTAGMSNYETLEKLQEFVDELNKKLPLYKQIQMVNIQEKGFEHTSAHKIKRNINQ